MTDAGYDSGTTRYALLGCGASKRPGVLPARAKYDSSYFAEKMKFAETFCDRWWILSAEHGILRPETEIDDYDTHIGDLSEQEVDHWTRDVYVTLRASDAKWVACDQLYVLLGKQYINAIQDILDELEDLSVSPVEVVYPFEGTEGIGDQRSWLSSAVEQRDTEPETEPDATADQTSLEVFG